ncbi:unnamed protein product, partial [Rotaria sp. Silwood1]
TVQLTLPNTYPIGGLRIGLSAPASPGPGTANFNQSDPGPGSKIREPDGL